MTRFLGAGILACSMMLAAPSAEAAPIMAPIAGDILGTIVILDAAPTSPIFDVNGFAIVAVVDLPSLTPLGSGFLVGSDPTIPQSNLLLLNEGPTEAMNLSFDFASSVFGGSLWAVPVTGTAITPVTHPALVGFLGPNNAAQFSIDSV